MAKAPELVAFIQLCESLQTVFGDTSRTNQLELVRAARGRLSPRFVGGETCTISYCGTGPSDEDDVGFE